MTLLTIRKLQRYGRWGLALEWKLADLWVGAFWRVSWLRRVIAGRTVLQAYTDVWICLVPCLAIHLTVALARFRENEPLRRVRRTRGSTGEP